MADPARILCGTALVLGLAACATVTNARRAQDPASAIPGERTPTAKELGFETTGPLVLDDAVRAALDVHPTVIAAHRNEEAARARVGEAEAAFLPFVSVNASETYRNQTPNVQPSSTERHLVTSAGFQVSWLLFDFGRTPALARQSAAQWLAAQEEARAADVDAVYNVRAAYFTLLRQLRLLEVAQDAVAQFEAHLEEVKEFVRVGATRIPYDQTKAEVDVGNARLELVQAEDAVLVAQAILANSMGLAETTDWSPDGTTTLPDPPDTFDACWQEARRSRPALAAAAAREIAAYELVNARVAELYPSLDLGLGFNVAGSSTPLPWSWQIGPSLSWVPFDGFQNLYTIDEAVANLRIARAARANLEQQTWLEVRTEWLATVDAKRRLELTQLLIRSAEENLTLAQGRFDAGKGTAIELTDAQQAVTQAKSDDVQARALLDLATALLWKAMGATGREHESGRKP